MDEKNEKEEDEKEQSLKERKKNLHILKNYQPKYELPRWGKEEAGGDVQIFPNHLFKQKKTYREEKNISGVIIFYV